MKWILIAMVWLNGHSVSGDPDWRKEQVMESRSACVVKQRVFVDQVVAKDTTARAGTVCISAADMKAGNSSRALIYTK